MKHFAVLALVTLLCACSRGGASPIPDSGWQGGLPAPSELHFPPAGKTVSSGSMVSLERTLESNGSHFVSFPGGSANTELNGNNATIHGGTGALNFAFYQISSTLFDQTCALSAISLEYEWTGGVPTAPEGLYVGLPDQVHDRWVWIDAVQAMSKWHDVSSMGLTGVDPATHPTGSFMVLVNASGGDVKVSRVALRFHATTSFDGDEQLFYMSRVSTDSPLLTNISKVGLDGAPPSVVWEHDSTPVIYGFPFVVNYHAAWVLTYVRWDVAADAEVWMSGLDGSAPWVIASASGMDVVSQGWEYGTDRGLYTRFSSGPPGERSLYGFQETPFETGLFGRNTDYVGKAVWDQNIDHAFTNYGAYAALRYDDIDDLYNIVHFDGNSPFPINATPTQVYAPLPGEDARNPEMVEVDNLSGQARYYLFFEAANRSGPNFNLYRIDLYDTGVVQPVLVDSTYDFRYPAPSWDGRYLAFKRNTAGSGPNSVGDLVVVDLLHPSAGEQVVANDCVGQISWYDPTP